MTKNWIVALSLLVVICSLVFGLLVARDQPLDLGEIKLEIQSKYPEVPQVSSRELYSLLNQEGSEKPILLDVREKEEYETSHLQGAIWIHPDTDPRQVLEKYSRDRKMVLYCSVGYRSSELARDLIRLGHDRIYNLAGSIFEWVNSGYRVYSGNKEINVVHPYSVYWGRFLKPEHQPNSS